MEKVIAGIDIGGTHITVCLVNPATGARVEDTLCRSHVDASLDHKSIISSWAETIRLAHAKAGMPIDKIGIAMPGPFDYEKGISLIRGLHKYESLYGRNVKSLLSETLGIPAGNIRMINDASAYLLGEMSSGAGAGFNRVVGITLGTGLGSAVYHNNTLYEGDLYCTDFEHGKCEDYASARWIVFEFEKISGIRANNVKEIAGRCDTDSRAREVFEKLGVNLYHILRKRYSNLQPEAVVIGGNIAKAWHHFQPAMLEEMKRHSFKFVIRQATLGEHAALTGAACLWQ